MLRCLAESHVSLVICVALLVVFSLYAYTDHRILMKKEDEHCDATNMLVQIAHEDKELAFGYNHSHSKRIVNSILLDYNNEWNQTFQDLVTQKVSSTDPRLTNLIQKMMDLPSHHIVKTVRGIVKTPQNKEIMNILRNKRGGFFIEAGALDGERSSNTLYLEQTMGWTGLLVEMDPYFYTQLLGKNRRSWSINACLSPHQHPTQMHFAESSGGGGKLIKDGGKTKKATVVGTIPCFPLESLLHALNVTHVDYFSLDVEGFELEILKTIPFDRLDIKTLSVEYVHGNSGKDTYRQFMEAKGYRVHKDIHYHEQKIAMFVDDFIFIKN